MEKILNIDGRQVKFKSTAAFLHRYKAQFGRDALQDLFKIEQSVDKDGKTIHDISALDLGVLFEMVWTLAKTADPSIPTPMEWLDEFSEFPWIDHLPEFMDMIRSSFKGTVESKKKV